MEFWYRKHLNKGGQGVPRPRRAAHSGCLVSGAGLGGAAMAEDDKNVPKWMVVIEWELTLPFIPGFKRLGQEDCHESRPGRAPE